jgi:hypothetical protein
LVTVVNAAVLSVIVFRLGMALITVLWRSVPPGPAPETTILVPIPIAPRPDVLATVSDVLPAVTDPVVVNGWLPPPWHWPQARSRSTHTAF